jgi:N-acetylneuraminic acid mutarotase
MKTITLDILFICQLHIATTSLLAQGWQTGESMPRPRTGICAVVFDDRIYVLGGRTASGQIVDIVECYDPFSDRWIAGLPELRDERENGAAVVLNNRIYALGGRDAEGELLNKVEYYNRTENKWEGSENLEFHREGLSAVVGAGRMYALGGFGFADNDGQQAHLLANVEVYDDAEEKWQLLPDWHLEQPAASFAALTIADFVYSIGGFSLFGPVALASRYEAATGLESLANMTYARGGIAAVATSDEIFVLGGRSTDDQVLDKVELYRTGHNEWQDVLPLQQPRENAAAVFVNGKIYVLGGQNAQGDVIGDVEFVAPDAIITAASDRRHEMPDDFILYHNFPNPFNPSTTLSFQVSSLLQNRVIVLSIRNLKGQQVRTLINEQLLPGYHRVSWDGNGGDGRPVASGIYIVSLRQGNLTHSIKIILRK